MRMKKNRVCILATILLILITASTCYTAPARIDAVDPALAFPRFPNPLDAEGNAIPVLDGENVTVPLWYWKKITEYVIDVEKTRYIYESWKIIYGIGEKDGNKS